MRPIKMISRLIWWGSLLAVLCSCNSLLDWEDTRACGDGVASSSEECDDGNTADGDGCSSACLVEYTPSKKVDLLFVVDFSLDMATFQATFYTRFPELLSWLKIVRGGLPDLHIGVTTMDVGAMGNVVPGCTGSGDDGRLQKFDCANLHNDYYIVDIAPVGCQIAQAQRPGEELRCTGHNCSDANCRSPIVQGMEPTGLILETDEQGCPRCRNYVEEPMGGIFQCLMTRSTTSCGWEQPLEAMMQALTMNHPENFNFRRPDAHLVVLFLTSEDDCTATTADLFNPGSELLGPYNGFRCWRWGVRCDREWELNPENLFEEYTNCRPRSQSEGGKLSDVNGYVNEVKRLVNSQGYRMFIQAVSLSGPHQTNLSIENKSTHWEVTPTEMIEGSPIMPNLRLYDFTWRLSSLADDMQWSFFSLLDSDWSVPLNRLGQRLREVIERSMTD